MHLHEEFSRSTSSIRMSGAAWQATVREVFGRSVARKYFWMLLANLRACEVKVFPSYSPKVGSGQRFHPQPTKGEGRGRERVGEGRRKADCALCHSHSCLQHR